MANSNQSSRMEVPQAKESMDKFKMEVASELGVPLKNGYNGNLTSAQAGSVGGEMVRQMIKKQVPHRLPTLRLSKIPKRVSKSSWISTLQKV